MPSNWEEARTWVASGSRDRLDVSCPRCARRGLVSPGEQGEYVIEWRDEARGWSWRDDAVTVQELAAPEFGCGHDRRTANGFVGGSPFVRASR